MNSSAKQRPCWTWSTRRSVQKTFAAPIFLYFFRAVWIVRIAGQRQWFSEVRLAPLAEFPGTRAMVGC